MIYMFDTNLCVYIIRKKPASVLRKLATYAPGHIGLSAITIAELQYGVDKSQHQAQNQQALAQFLLPFVIVEFGYDAAVAYGGIRATLERAGTPIGGLDTLIAAHALSLDLALVTNNTREFARVPGLRLEDWVAAEATE
ncbi:MAG: type II toxin-antitoxin system VapC family toxin [Chloroflexales bacterium]|nr:type II toxin-antitoxin system VapC family toxin [Chloroflexales bacterium]